MLTSLKSPVNRADRLSGWTVLLFLGAALGLLLVDPGILFEGGSIRVLVHLITLGGILGAFYPLQNALWQKLYGRPPLWPWLSRLIWMVHTLGVILLIWGFIIHSTLLAQLGGHYLVPTAIALAVGQGVATAVKRIPGRERHLAAHLPGLGLLVTMGLGAMMVLDAYGGGYNIYTPHTIMLHAGAGVFLFFLPFSLCMQIMSEVEASEPSQTSRPPEFTSTAPLLIPVGSASLGVLALALAGIAGAETLQDADLPPVRIWMAGGLGLLGAVALWVGLPAFGLGKPLTLQGLRRTPWSALGLLLLYAAIRAARATPEGEYLALMRFSVVLFLFALALPEVLSRLAREFAPEVDEAAERSEAVQMVVLLFVAGLVLVAQLGGLPLLARMAAVLGLALLCWQGKRLWDSARA